MAAARDRQDRKAPSHGRARALGAFRRVAFLSVSSLHAALHSGDESRIVCFDQVRFTRVAEGRGKGEERPAAAFRPPDSTAASLRRASSVPLQYGATCISHVARY